MKYKDPITGELRDVIIKSGDTLPIGTIVDFDGDVIPDGYEEATEASDVVNSLEGNEIYRAPSVKVVNEVLNGNKAMGSIVVEDVTCRNMFNKYKALIGQELNGGDGTTTSNSNLFVSDYIKVNPNTTYFISGKTSGQSNCFYDKDKNFISTIKIANGVITTPNNENICYVRFNGTLTEISTVQFEPGKVASNYIESKEFSNQQIYSTTEQLIGSWNGKPLYRKVFNIGLLPNATNLTIAHNLPSIDMIRTNGSFGIANGYSVPIPNASAGSSINGQIAINVDRSNIYLTTNSNRSDLTGYIILEYTKTTD